MQSDIVILRMQGEGNEKRTEPNKKEWKENHNKPERQKNEEVR